MRYSVMLGAAGALALASGGCDSSRESFVLASADSRNGIQGTLISAEAAIRFESRLHGDLLEARISTADGELLWSYREDGDSVPRIAVGGTSFSEDFLGMSAEQMVAVFQQQRTSMEQAYHAVATSPAGPLVRQLAMELVRRAPAPALVAERRGLETAFQAMQQAYPDGYPATSTASTSDYYYSPQAGYLVLSQHPLAYFRHNYQVAADAHGAERALRVGGPSRYDDETQVGSCFGHCGAGCTNDWGGCTWGGWSHVYAGATYLFGQTTVSCRCAGGIQQELCDLYDIYATPAWHTYEGKAADGCVAHDQCCRTMFWGCGNPACIALLPEALASSCGPSTWAARWTYFGDQYEYRYSGSVSVGYCEAG